MIAILMILVKLTKTGLLKKKHFEKQVMTS